MERGRGGKGEREGWGDHLPYSPPPPLASASNTTLRIGWAVAIVTSAAYISVT